MTIFKSQSVSENPLKPPSTAASTRAGDGAREASSFQTVSQISNFKWQIAVATVALVLVALLAPAPLTLAAPQVRHITVQARSFAFEPGVLRVNRGDTIVLTVESLDMVHGLYVDGYDVNVVVEPGQSAQAHFVADRPGKFKFRCSISCGTLHPFMIGELVVEPNLPFWRAVAVTLITVMGATVAFWKA